MLKYVVAAIGAALALNFSFAQAQPAPISPSSVSKISDREITITHGETPSFIALTAGKAAFGIFGALATKGSGDQIVTDNEIKDPADYIGTQLQAIFQDKLNGHPIEGEPKILSKNVEEICKNSAGADVILDVRTKTWMLSYFPTDWSHYRVSYTVSIRLIDVKTKEVLAEDVFKSIPDKTPDAPTKDEALANQAERLKHELKKAADAAIEEFTTKILQVASKEV